MGHIDLATPVAHIWFLKSSLAHRPLLDMSSRSSEDTLLESYVVVDPGHDPAPERELLFEGRYAAVEEHGPTPSRPHGCGGHPELLKKLDVDRLFIDLRVRMKEATSEARRKKISKRLKVISAFQELGNRPEWLILEVVPVIPPDLRPLCHSTVAASRPRDRTTSTGASSPQQPPEAPDGAERPDIIIRNEKRCSRRRWAPLFDNGRRGRAITGPNKRPLKSLSDMLKGKSGRFRQTCSQARRLLGRSVIVVARSSASNQCGLPKKMASSFQAFIYNKLEGAAASSRPSRAPRRWSRRSGPEVWESRRGDPRAPGAAQPRADLHRLGIQPSSPILIEGKAIQLHPLVCAAYNATSTATRWRSTCRSRSRRRSRRARS